VNLLIAAVLAIAGAALCVIAGQNSDSVLGVAGGTCIGLAVTVAYTRPGR
jgi:hypothetical protein